MKGSTYVVGDSKAPAAEGEMKMHPEKGTAPLHPMAWMRMRVEMEWRWIAAMPDCDVVTLVKRKRMGGSGVEMVLNMEWVALGGVEGIANTEDEAISDEAAGLRIGGVAASIAEEVWIRVQIHFHVMVSRSKVERDWDFAEVSWDGAVAPTSITDFCVGVDIFANSSERFGWSG
ncbi:unnamed protein product [Strongylus vulgaris]|uniref:Uncharacterized protein n=1 Tax=Strongylus vulgaris TaxID=40348 RepID=A0A3P7JIU3_STRVU|nr:unnamed protein product [Strongylus vulgaris]